MPAYNRVTQQFQDNLSLDASDLNAFEGDLKAWMLRQLGGSGSRTSIASLTARTTDRSDFFADTTATTADAAPSGRASVLMTADRSSAFSDTTLITADAA